MYREHDGLARLRQRRSGGSDDPLLVSDLLVAPEVDRVDVRRATDLGTRKKRRERRATLGRYKVWDKTL